MPITKKQFEEGNFTVLRGRTLEILEFLKKNKDTAYTAREIADNFKTKPLSINPALKRLSDQGILQRKKPYYIFAGDKPVVKQTQTKPAPVQERNPKKIHLNPQAKGEELEEDEDFDVPE
jgi:hypothetical protein